MDFLDIFSAYYDCLVIGYLTGKETFGFWLILTLWWLLKEVTCQSLMADLCNLGLEQSFWTFSVLKMIALYCAIWIGYGFLISVHFVPFDAVQRGYLKGYIS